MNVINTFSITNKLALHIVEVNNPVAVKYFNNRFQVIVEHNNKKKFPKNKKKYLSFKDNDYIYIMNSDRTNEDVNVDMFVANELMLCDISIKDCMSLVGVYCTMSIPNALLELKQNYKL